ncbi:MAG: glycoside hydrolase family 3 C-terminal domain-containing protein [Oscillospiraceae bacterium]
MINRARLQKIKQLVDKMTLAEKISFCSSDGFFSTEYLKRLGIMPMTFSAGPLGQSSGADGIRSATSFPCPAALGCTFDRELVRDIGSALGEEARISGVSLLLAPNASIKRNALHARGFEHFSEDPCLAGELAAAEIQGIQERGVGSCLCGFVAENREDMKYVSDSCVDLRALNELYIEPFRRAVKKSKPHAIMTACGDVNGENVAESEYLVTKVLKERLGFDGSVISGIGSRARRDYSLKAGTDCEIPGERLSSAREIQSAIKKNSLSVSELDDAVVHNLSMITTCQNPSFFVMNTDYVKHHSLARQAAEESMVLLKNNDSLLPFDDKKPFAVIGALACDTLMSADGGCAAPMRASSVIEELDYRKLDYIYAAGCLRDGSTNDTLVAEAKKAAACTGRAVIFAGLSDASKFSDRSSMALPDGILKLVDSVASACESVAVVLLVPAPVELPFADRVSSLLLAYPSGQGGGEAIADVLTGRASPDGRLAETWPMRMSDIPGAVEYKKNKKTVEYREGMYVGYRYYDAAGESPRFCFGCGQGYTEFEYDAFSCNRQELSEKGRLELTFRVKNIGKRSGRETVQVYIEKSGAKMKKLCDFKKLHLFADEARIVSMRLSVNDFNIFNPETDDWQPDSGIYRVLIASSSAPADVRGQFAITINSHEQAQTPPYFDVQNAKAFDSANFCAAVGYIPKEREVCPYSLSSTPNELQRKLIGKIALNVIVGRLAFDERTRLHRCGYISEENFCDMPLKTLVSLSDGDFSLNKAKSIVGFANKNLFRGIYHALKK